MSTRLRLEDISHLPLPGTDVPAAIRFAPGGEALTYLQSTDGSLVRSLWWHDLRSGERRVVAGPLPGTEQRRDDRARGAAAAGADAHERARRHRVRLGHARCASRRWPCRWVAASWSAPESMPAPRSRPSPRWRASTGSRAPSWRQTDSMSRSSAMATCGSRALGGGTPRRLTDDAEPGVFNGLAEFIAAEELEPLRGPVVEPRRRPPRVRARRRAGRAAIRDLASRVRDPRPTRSTAIRSPAGRMRASRCV